MRISWTPRARSTYFDILDYLENAWTEREIKNFITEVEHLLNQIKENPDMFEKSEKMKNIRKGFISKHNTLYYRVRPRKKEVQLLLFWNNRMDPGKLDL